MKPHEEKWEAESGEHGGREVRVQGGSTVAFCPGSDAEAQETARFIAAAPDMARALLALEDHKGRLREDGEGCVFCLARFTTTHTPDCPVILGREALQKAGVLP